MVVCETVLQVALRALCLVVLVEQVVVQVVLLTHIRRVSVLYLISLVLVLLMDQVEIFGPQLQLIQAAVALQTYMALFRVQVVS